MSRRCRSRVGDARRERPPASSLQAWHRRLRLVPFVVSCLLLGSPGARAQADDLTLDDVLRSVERSYPLILAALAERSEARGQLRAARGGFDPTLEVNSLVEPIGGYPKQVVDVSVQQPTPLWGTSVFAGYRLGTGDYASYEGKLQTLDGGELRGGVRVPLLREGPIDGRRAGIRTSDIDVDLATLGAAQQQIEARRLASLRYLDWASAGMRLEVVRSWLKLAQVRDQALAERVARGEVADFERIENQRAILQRESALVAAERDLAQAAVELSLFVRTDDGTPRIPGVDELPEALPDPAEHDVASGDAERTALSARPDLQRMVLQRSRVEVAEALASNQRLPGLSVQATGSQDLGTGDPKKVDPVFELMLRFDFPLLNRGATGRTAAARAALRRVDAQTQFARDRALVEVRTAMVNMDAARTRVDITAKELEVARALASGELARFELGESTLLLVNLREQASAEAQLRHVDVLAEYHRAQASLRAAMAQNASSASTGAAGTGDDG